MDMSLEPGFEKIAIYAKNVAGKFEPKHAARQLDNGCWTSKLGQADDIEHLTADCITGGSTAGSDYGQVVRIMKRPR